MDIERFNEKKEQSNELSKHSTEKNFSEYNQLILYDIINIQENERKRIAEELHDSSIQNLTHLIHMIELSMMYIDKDFIRAKLELENCIKLLKSTINEMRDTIYNLRPMAFDDLGFKKSIDELVTNVRKESKNIEIEYNVCELNIENNLLLVTIYRIIKEILVNASKHSNGNKIILNVTVEDKNCIIYIKDNGKGFSFEDLDEKRDKHFGIPILKERTELLQGTFSIYTEPEMGTEVKIQIPLI